jgi:hypothetical protein
MAGRIMSMKKNPLTPSGIELATFRLVAQCLNQLRHRLPQRSQLVLRNWYLPDEGTSSSELKIATVVTTKPIHVILVQITLSLLEYYPLLCASEVCVGHKITVWSITFRIFTADF